MSSLDSEIVFYAFRYCLGRQTYAAGTCADYLVAHWDELEEGDRKLIVKEIRKALAEGKAGAACDVQGWQSVLRRAEKEDLFARTIAEIEQSIAKRPQWMKDTARSNLPPDGAESEVE